MKILSWIISLALFGAALSYWLPVEGPWLDPILSRYFSKQVGLELSVRGARVSHWNKIHFRSLGILIMPDLPKLSSGEGVMELKNFPFSTKGREEAVLIIKDVALPASLYNKLPTSFLTNAESVSEALKLNRIKLSISREGSSVNYHLLECLSDELSLKGGLTVSNSRIARVHALLFLRSELLGKIPENMGSRLMGRAGGWRGLRVLYNQHTLTALGANGPFFKADWK